MAIRQATIEKKIKFYNELGSNPSRAVRMAQLQQLDEKYQEPENAVKHYRDTALMIEEGERMKAEILRRRAARAAR